MLMKIQSILFLILSSLFSHLLNSHGFSSSTPIWREDKVWPIEQIYNNPQKQKLWVSSFDQDLQSITSQEITRVGKSQSNCCIRIAFDANKNNDIILSSFNKLIFIVPSAVNVEILSK